MKRILLGRILRAHGIKGELVLATYTGAPAAIGDYGPLSDESGNRTYVITIVRVTPKGVIARVTGVPDRTAAEQLKGIDLYVDRARLPDPEDGAYYHEDLVGLAAVATDGAVIGEIVSVQNFGAGNLVEIRLAGAKRTELVPFTDAFVPEVDIAAGRAVVVMPVATADDDTDHDADRPD